MNFYLLENALEYHGPTLYNEILSESKGEIALASSAPVEPKLENDENLHDDEISNFKSPKEKQLYSSIVKFIASKSQILYSKEFSTLQRTADELEHDPEHNHNTRDPHWNPAMPPLESFMRVPFEQARKHLFKILEPGDILIGVVNSVIERSGIIIQLLYFDSEKKKRDIESLKINAFCSLADLVQSGIKNALSIFQPNDLVRCVLKSVDKLRETCEVCFAREPSPKKLGLISSSELPASYQQMQYNEDRHASYEHVLTSQKSFNNSACVSLMSEKLGLNLKALSHLSLMNGLFNIKIDADEMASELRRKQTRQMALQSVAKGIALFKENKPNEAMLLYNKALSIDEENVEALVARGALYANQGEYEKAIEDFEKALDKDPKHANAIKYLEEVFMDRAIKLEKANLFDDSIAFYRKLIALGSLKEVQIEVIEKKIDEIKEKKQKAFSKPIFGPQIPVNRTISQISSESSKHKKKKRSSSTSSSSSSSSSSTSSSSSSTSTSTSATSSGSSSSDRKSRSRHKRRSTTKTSSSTSNIDRAKTSKEAESKMKNSKSEPEKLSKKDKRRESSSRSISIDKKRHKKHSRSTSRQRSSKKHSKSKSKKDKKSKKDSHHRRHKDTKTKRR